MPTLTSLERAPRPEPDLLTDPWYRVGHPDFFIDRYAEAYKRELNDFVDALNRGVSPAVGGADGRMALLLADAAQASLDSGDAVRL